MNKDKSDIMGKQYLCIRVLTVFSLYPSKTVLDFPTQFLNRASERILALFYTHTHTLCNADGKEGGEAKGKEA